MVNYKLVFSITVLWFASVSFPLNGFAQNNLEFLNDSINGTHFIPFSNGKKHLEYEITDGKLNGKIIKYFRCGKVQEIIEIKNNKYSGKISVFDKKGRMIFLQIANNDSLIQEIDSGFYFLSKHLHARWYWNRNEDHDLDLLSTKNKLPFTKFWEYYGYVPAINGTKTVYDRSGKIRKIQKRTNAKRNGEWKWFNKKGMLIKTIVYENGQILSKKTTF